MTKAIIFDWAGVIGADGYWVWLQKNIPDINGKKDYFQELSEKVDSAQVSHKDFEKMLSEISGKPGEQVWQEVKHEIVINHDLIQIMKRLKSKYKIGLLSNFTYPWLNELLVENNLYGIFDAHIVSSVHGVIKPSREAFEKILRLLDVQPGESIFIDDRQINIDGARKLGIEGLLFTSNTQLVHDLEKLGVGL